MNAIGTSQLLDSLKRAAQTPAFFAFSILAGCSTMLPSVSNYGPILSQFEQIDVAVNFATDSPLLEELPETRSIILGTGNGPSN